ncbi:unnamed protein product, partial [Brachionus calyciflorus]
VLKVSDKNNLPVENNLDLGNNLENNLPGENNLDLEIDDQTQKKKEGGNIADIQETCSHNLRNAAEKMAQQHIHKLGESKVGDTVQVPVHEVDRGAGDLLNILAYIVKINKQLATKHGIIKGWFSRNMFHICKQKLISPESLD